MGRTFAIGTDGLIVSTTLNPKGDGEIVAGFTVPMSAITTAFHGILKEAGLPTFRAYDCQARSP
jgi:hypothetical protein